MKKVLWLIVCLMTIVVSANAQSETNDTQETYCMIVGTQKFMSSKCTFTIDYGQSTRFLDGATKMKLTDENGETIKFNSLMDAAKFFAKDDKHAKNIRSVIWCCVHNRDGHKTYKGLIWAYSN